MAVYAARQSTYNDNDVITAAHSNDEFNAILAAFHQSTGHVHDGTAGGGSPIVKIGPSQDIEITASEFKPKTDDTVDLGTSSLEYKDLYIDGLAYIDGLGEDLLVATDKKIQFRDTGLYISSNADGDLDIVSDGTAVDSINIESAGGITLDAGTAGSGIIYEDDGTEMLRVHNSSSDVILETKVSDKDFIVKGNDGGSTITALTIDMSEAGAATFNNKIVATELDISGNVDVDGTLEADAITINDISLAETISDTVGAMVGSNTETGISVTYDDSDNTLDFALASAQTTITSILATDLKLGEDDQTKIDFETANEIHFYADNVSLISLTNANSGDAVLTVPTADKNFTIKGTDGSSSITALDIDMALAGKATFNGDVVVTGDLTITGDDLTMGTNTSGHIMVADGTNFNPVAVSGDVTMASNGAVTIANGAVETAMVNANVITGQTAETSLDTSNDVILIHDASASALRKTTLASISSALGGITDVVADTSPQLGGNLDTNSHNILIDDAHFIADENGNEQIIFQTTSSAVNQFDITNAATGNAPELSATGGDTNISLKITPKGSGQVLLDGNVGVESGLIDLKNSGSRSQIKFYCESGNAHAQTLQAAPHSEAASNTLTLPSTGGDVDLVSTASTATLTNKTLTSPKINEDVAVTATATEINLLDGVTSTTSELNILDGVTSTASELNLVDGSSAGTIANSKAVIYGSSGEVNATTLQIAGTSITSTAAELNILDGVTATATELNIMDGDTSASSTTLVDADRVVTNDNGTMKQVALTDVKTYLTSAGFTTDDPTALAIALG